MHSATPPACPPAYNDFCGFLETSSKQIADDILVRCGNCGLACHLGHSLHSIPLFLLLCGVLEVCNKLAKGAFLTVGVVKVLDAFYCIVCKFGICSNARIGEERQRGKNTRYSTPLYSHSHCHWMDGWRLGGKRKSESHLDEFSNIISRSINYRSVSFVTLTSLSQTAVFYNINECAFV